MSVVCFGSFAKVIKNAIKVTSPTDEDVVYLLLGSITHPLSLKNKNGGEFLFDKKEISGYMTSKLNVPSVISNAAPLAKDSIVTSFEKEIVSKLTTAEERSTLLDATRLLVQNDVAVPPNTRNNFILLAKDDSLAAFICDVFVYAVKVDNVFNAPKKAGAVSSHSTIYLSDSETYLLAEVNMACAKCSGSFMKTKGANAVPEYAIASIYLLNPTPAQDAVLKTLPLPTYGFDDFENKIALCLKCKNEYLAAFSADEYNNLLSLKTEASKLYQARLSLDKIETENDLTEIISKLASIPQQDLGKSLSMKALRVDKKIPATNAILRIKVSSYATPYFYYVRDLFGNVSRKGSFNYDLLAQEIKLACERLLARNLSQNDIFDELSRWVKKVPK